MNKRKATTTTAKNQEEKLFSFLCDREKTTTTKEKKKEIKSLEANKNRKCEQIVKFGKLNGKQFRFADDGIFDGGGGGRGVN